MMAVAGADMVCSTLPLFKWGFSRSFASLDITNTKRAGVVLLVVGPQRARSYAAIRSCGVTGSGRHLRWVRALRNKTSSASSLTARLTVIASQLRSYFDHDRSLKRREQSRCPIWHCLSLNLASV